MATKKRILFTGGSGKAGKHVVPYLLDKGHRVVNVDLTPLDHPGVDNLTADITDSGQMFNVMSSYAISTSWSPAPVSPPSTPWCISRLSRAS
jgi:nucleoside-diphosphate-sugar epimerase